MLSPFPGLDPFIEACGLWEDFHTKLIGEIERSLAPLLPERYVVRTGERAYVVLSPAVAERPPTPVTMRALVESEFRETFVEIRELNPQHRLVTCIEVLSPSNKRADSPGWVQYLRKRQALLSSYANLIEIDLLRGGRRLPMEDDWPDSPYYLLVARKERAPRCEVWPAHFLHPLPEVPVPLATPDVDVTLSLQPLIDAVYARSRYAADLDYRRTLGPPLSPEEAAGVKERLRGGKF